MSFLRGQDELNDWQRTGTGRGLQFYANDDEIAEWLLRMLPSAQAPYTILGQEWVDGSWRSFEHQIEEIRGALMRHRGLNQWIRSLVLSPNIDAADLTGPESIGRLSLSGLILVNSRQELAKRREPAMIAIVDRIRNKHTAEEVNHSDYLRIFERLRRSMRRQLIVETVQRFADGSVGHGWRMTARAADAHVRGDISFDAEPVDLRPVTTRASRTRR